MDIKKTINKILLDFTFNELRFMNKGYPFASLSYNSQLYLDIINHTKNCTITFLADKLHISKPAVTIKIKELMLKGFLTKTQSTEDKRVIYITPTQEIKQLYRESDKYLETFVNTLKSNYSEKEVNLFLEMLGHMSIIFAGD